MRVIIDAFAGRASAIAALALALAHDADDYQPCGPLSTVLAVSDFVGVLPLRHSPFND
jgi:hypothetical protein